MCILESLFEYLICDLFQISESFESLVARTRSCHSTGWGKGVQKLDENANEKLAVANAMMLCTVFQEKLKMEFVYDSKIG